MKHDFVLEVLKDFWIYVMKQLCDRQDLDPNEGLRRQEINSKCTFNAYVSSKIQKQGRIGAKNAKLIKGKPQNKGRAQC